MTAPVFAWHNEMSNTFFGSVSTINVGADNAAGTNGAFTAGTILVATVVTGAASITPPAGWTAIASPVTDADGFLNGFYWHLCNGSESGSFPFVLGSSAGTTWGLLAYTGAAASPIDGASIAVWNSNGGTTIAVPFPSGSITTTNATDLLILIVTTAGSTTFTIPADMTQRVNGLQNSSNFDYMAGDKTLSSSGTQSDSFTASAAFRHGSYALFALSPAGGAAARTPTLTLMGVG